jgi:hypothetical protein
MGNSSAIERIKTTHENSTQKSCIWIAPVCELRFPCLCSKQNITYTGDTVTNFANPERGWYHSYVADCCDKLGATSDAEPLELKAPHAPIVLSDLQAIRNTPERMTLYRDIVKINQYSGPIPQARLNEIQADLNTARKAGVKVYFGSFITTV